MAAVKLVQLYMVTAVFFFAIDILWLGVIAKNFYNRHLAQFFRERVNWAAAAIFYALYILGIMIFAILPGISSASLARTVILGVLYGLFTYATYDLTNLATIKDWPVKIVVVDILWGMMLCGLVSAGGFVVATRFL
ncbi:MAG: DUF2177 family protein [Deltaproteobacteria bacterium]|nr:MAG: DUF2177 family protein [Deltaproteobacteria bacterium]